MNCRVCKLCETPLGNLCVSSYVCHDLGGHDAMHSFTGLTALNLLEGGPEAGTYYCGVSCALSHLTLAHVGNMLGFIEQVTEERPPPVAPSRQHFQPKVGLS